MSKFLGNCTKYKNRYLYESDYRMNSVVLQTFDTDSNLIVQNTFFFKPKLKTTLPIWIEYACIYWIDFFFLQHLGNGFWYCGSNDLIEVILPILLNFPQVWKLVQSEIAQKICELNTTLNENDKSGWLTILHGFDEIQSWFCLHLFSNNLLKSPLMFIAASLLSNSIMDTKVLPLLLNKSTAS